MLAAGQVVYAIATRISGLMLGADVYTSRAWPLAQDRLPAWRVVAADEQVTPQTVHRDPYFQHVLDVELRGVVSASADIDTDMHALTAEALTALFDPSQPDDPLTTLGPALQLTLTRIERSMATEGEASVGQVVVTLQATYRTRASTPEAFT